ncbi:MAG: DNA polymerase III subunit alpha [Halanaerobiales bacterium]
MIDKTFNSNSNCHFCHIHNHSHYSLLDGGNSPKELVKKAKEMGHKAIALTDHGAIHGFYELYSAAREEGIKSIIGVEAYEAEDINEKSTLRYHLIILAKNKLGIKNLFQMITKANTEGFYYKPRIDFSMLKQYHEGLIVSSACMQGKLSYFLRKGNYERAKKEALKYKNLFGDDFYIEIMANNLNEQYDLNEQLIKLSKETDIDLIATNDIHYINQEDSEGQNVMLAINTGGRMGTGEYEMDPEYYFKDERTVRSQLVRDPEKYKDEIDQAIYNTGKIADKVEDYNFNEDVLLPTFKVPEGETIESYLRKKCYKKLFDLSIKKDIDMYEYVDRLEYEIEIIEMKGFPAYFLIVSDYTDWAKKNDIVVGPGRGSAGGSLVAYLLNIIAFDPIKYGLMFDRFLNPEREAYPDIDLDFHKGKDGRDKVIDYVVDKYGRDKVSKICTFGTMAARGVIRDVGRTLGIDNKITDKIAKSIPKIPGITIKKALEESDEFKQYEKEYTELFKYARKVESSPKNLSTHASAVVITPRPVTNYTPLARTINSQTKEVDYVTQTEMHDSESLGLLKMDFLGLKTLNIIKKCIDFIHNRSDVDKLDFVPTVQNIWEQIPLNNTKVFKEIYQKADTNGVFQVESGLFKDLVGRMKPTRFEHIIALVALGRPGPIGAGLVDSYINRMHGREKIEYPHEDLKPILEETYGLPIYQEQVMGMARIIAGFSLGQADILRRGMGKKKKKVIDKMKVKFINGAIKNGHTEEFAKELFETIEYFAGYGFNKSHSMAYGLISYCTAYLKANFPAEFYAALMTLESEKSSTDSNIANYISDCYRKKIKVLPPDINDSKNDFVAVDGVIRFGLGSINGVGKKAMINIIKNQPYNSFEDFYERTDNRTVKKDVVHALIKAGAFDRFKENRKELIEDYKRFKNHGTKAMTLFDPTSLVDTTYTEEDTVRMELETLHMSITYPSLWDKAKDGTILTMKGYITESKERTDKKNKLMAFAKFKTKKNIVRLVVFSSVYLPNNDLFQKDFVLEVKGEKSGDSLLVKEVELLEGDFFAEDNEKVG